MWKKLKPLIWNSMNKKKNFLLYLKMKVLLCTLKYAPGYLFFSLLETIKDIYLYEYVIFQKTYDSGNQYGNKRLREKPNGSLARRESCNRSAKIRWAHWWVRHRFHIQLYIWFLCHISSIVRLQQQREKGWTCFSFIPRLQSEWWNQTTLADWTVC